MEGRAGQFGGGDGVHLAVGVGRWPHDRRGVFPQLFRVAVKSAGDGAGELPGQIFDEARSTDPDHRDHATGPHEVGEASQALSGVELMQRRDRDHGVERCRFERIVHDVSTHVFDVCLAGVFDRQGDTGIVEVDADDVSSLRGELSGQMAVTAADIEHSVGAARNSPEESRVVVDVVVPPLRVWNVDRQ